MNKNHLLPSLLFVLAACGGAASSTPSSSASITLDQNEYRLVGSQSNVGSWTPANAPVMTRAAGTNSFSITRDVYKDSEFKIVIGTDWANGEVGPRSAGLTISVGGVAWTKDNAGELVIPEASTIEASGDLGAGNFKAREDGSYTVTFVSLPALTRTLSIVRNGDPEVPAPTITTWALVGTINGWTAADMSYKLVNENDANLAYSLTLNLFENEEFKFVKNGAWGGDLGFSALVNPNSEDLTDSGGNIKVVRSGSFSITFNGTTATITRLGDVAELNGGLKLVGSVQSPAAWEPSDNTFALIFDGGMYYGRFELPLDAEVKVKNGATWGEGFDAGFGSVASMPTGAFVNAGGNIKAAIAGFYRFAVRVVGQSLIINISHSYLTYGGMTAVETRAGSVINYVNSPANFWESGALVKFGNADGTKTTLKVDFTGVLDTEYLFKFELQGGNNAAGTFVEFRFVGTGAAQTAELSLVSLTEAQRATMNLFVVFVTTPGTTGAITISNVYYA